MSKNVSFGLATVFASWICSATINATDTATYTATELAINQDDSITFERHVRPILKAHCFHCHGEDGEKEAGIDLRLVRLMKESGAVDSAVPSASMLLEQVESGAMPSGAKKLPDEEIDLIRRWLETGLKTIRVEPEVVPDYEITEIERSHWAFQPIVSPSIPSNGQSHPIDALVRAKMTEKEFDFAPTADKVTLLRRASYDLHGIPPTPEAVDAFVNDNEDGGWLRAIDRLLASPHYGERWGRHWLDVVGYADSNGGPKDSTRDHAWHYRDYVVRAFNEDKPWTDFIQEQVAGDELAGITEENAEQVLADSSQWDRLAATGFLRMAPDFTGDDPTDFHVAAEAVVADNIKVIASAFLGLTVGCAQCHDHRFDPISHVDYFRLRALVDPIYDQNDWRAPAMRLHSAYTGEESAINAKTEEKASAVDDARDQLIKRKYHEYLEEKLKAVEESLRDSIRVAWMVPPEKRSEEQASLLEKHDFKFWYAGHLRFLPDCDEEEQQREKMVHEVEEIRATKISRVFMSATEKKDAIPDTRRFHRGDYRQPKESVGPGDLSIFHDAPQISLKSDTTPSSGRRLAYSRWLTSGQHPIVARVIVNRFWMQHFGKGLVAQAADFGMRTPIPVQNQLLDFLSSQFMEHGWSLKEWHRLVMTSQTYMQGNRNPVSESQDADNLYLSRRSIRRLEAEAVRDSILAASGNLLPSIGGRPLLVARHPLGGIVLGKELSNPSNGVVHTVEPLGEESQRRSLYVQHLRNRPLSVLQTFDMPMMTPNCNQRSITTVAPQSLMMLNDTFIIEQSRIFANRLVNRFHDDLVNQVNTIWNNAYGVLPTDEERLCAIALVQEEEVRQMQVESLSEVESTAEAAKKRALAALCQVVFASNRFLYAP